MILFAASGESKILSLPIKGLGRKLLGSTILVIVLFDLVVILNFLVVFSEFRLNFTILSFNFFDCCTNCINNYCNVFAFHLFSVLLVAVPILF